MHTALPLQQPDVLVIGLGAMGSATLMHLAARGAQVLGIDQYAPPHAQGSTHGETRITRAAVGEGADFVPLVLRSHQLWRELEARTGADLYRTCGGLILARTGLASPMHGQGNFFDRTLELARQFSIPHHCLDAAEIAARYPQFILQGDERGYFEPGAGYLCPEACVATHTAEAQRMGARIHTGERVLAISKSPSGWSVETDRTTYRPGQIVVCAGPWLPQLLGAALPPLRVTRQVLYWFEPAPTQNYDDAHFPIFIWNWGAGADDVYYGFPDLGGGVKVATESHSAITTPEQIDRAVSAAEIQDMYQRHVHGRLRELGPHCTRNATCLYTEAADARFLIDHISGANSPLVVSACSGHGFKHSAAIGEAVAQWLEVGVRPALLAPFAQGSHDTGAGAELRGQVPT